MPTWPLPDWVTYTTAAVLLVTVVTETVLHQRVMSDLRKAMLWMDVTKRPKGTLPENAPALQEGVHARLARFQRLQRRVFLPVTVVFMALMATQILTTLVTR